MAPLCASGRSAADPMDEDVAQVMARAAARAELGATAAKDTLSPPSTMSSTPCVLFIAFESAVDAHPADKVPR
jgi:hypothetical protein